jgi:ABC-type nickel/cobalt efflux system permease component RcnA
MNSHRNTLYFLAAIMAAVLAWGMLHALGAYLYNLDPRKPLIVSACTLFFLGLWLLMLVARQRRLRREFETLPPDDLADASPAGGPPEL